MLSRTCHLPSFCTGKSMARKKKNDLSITVCRHLGWLQKIWPTQCEMEVESEGPPPLEDARRQPLAAVDSRQKPPTSAKGKSCPLCGQKASRLAAHMRTTHFPWFWEPTAACWHFCISLGRAECLESHLLSCPALERAHFTSERHQQWTQLMCGAIAVLLELGRASTAQDLVARIVPRLPTDFTIHEEELAMVTLHDQAAFGSWHQNFFEILFA